MAAAAPQKDEDLKVSKFLKSQSAKGSGHWDATGTALAYAGLGLLCWALYAIAATDWQYGSRSVWEGLYDATWNLGPPLLIGPLLLVARAVLTLLNSLVEGACGMLVTVGLVGLSRAVMFVVPVDLVNASPFELPLSPISATTVFDETQLTVVVTSAVLPSSKVPVALNCTWVPSATDGFTGEIAMAASVFSLTVTVLLPDTSAVGDGSL